MNLVDAIESVYAAFSDTETPVSVDGCPCCMAAEEYETLTAKPLRELTVDDLGKYSRSALLTMGTEADYSYFLPRILELTIGDDGDWITSVEITAEKMRMAGFEGWTKRRHLAINDLWLTVIREIATEGDPELLEFRAFDIDSWLAAATLIPLPVSPLLSSLEGSPVVLRTLYNKNFMTISQGRLDNAFLKEPSEGQTEIANWLRNQIESNM